MWYKIRKYISEKHNPVCFKRNMTWTTVQETFDTSSSLNLHSCSAASNKLLWTRCSLSSVVSRLSGFVRLADLVFEKHVRSSVGPSNQDDLLNFLWLDPGWAKASEIDCAKRICTCADTSSFFLARLALSMWLSTNPLSPSHPSWEWSETAHSLDSFNIRAWKKCDILYHLPDRTSELQDLRAQCTLPRELYCRAPHPKTFSWRTISTNLLCFPHQCSNRRGVWRCLSKEVGKLHLCFHMKQTKKNVEKCSWDFGWRTSWRTSSLWNKPLNRGIKQEDPSWNTINREWQR